MLQILVGPPDSTEHRNSAGKEGVGKFAIHNLPAAQIGPGVYELGVTAPSWSQASNKQLSTRPLKSENVMPVYIGQGANIRQRLQKYGQANAHLELGSRYGKLQRIIHSQVMSIHPNYLFHGILHNLFACCRSPKQYQGDSNSVGSRSPRTVQGTRSAESAKSAGSAPGLFSEVFALGCSIAFRWAHVRISDIILESYRRHGLMMSYQNFPYIFKF